MTQNSLYRCQRNAFLEGQGGKGMPQHVGRYRLSDVGAIGHTLDDFLHLPGADEPGVMKSKIRFQQGLDARGHGHDPNLGFLPVRSALAADSDGFLLPQDMVLSEAAKLGDAKSRI
jgi:hypothetical protein